MNVKDLSPTKTDGSNRFAYNTIKIRIPSIIAEVMDRNAHFSEALRADLTQLRDGLKADSVIPPLEQTAWDYEMWEVERQRHRSVTSGESRQGGPTEVVVDNPEKPTAEPTWLNTEWFFAETFLYRHILQAVRYWEFEQDPFSPYKEEELNGPNIPRLMETGLHLKGDREERLEGVLGLALWGNRIDLSYKASMAHGSDLLDEEDLVINEAEPAVQRLLSHQGTVHLVTDNAGSELASDLILADFLLHELGLPVWFHVKLYPTYVSDATAFDVREHIRRLQAGWDTGTQSPGGPDFKAIRQLGERLAEALQTGRFRIVPDQIWNSPFFLDRLPDRLLSLFAEGCMVIFKGDVNYRRILRDAIPPPDGSFSDILSFFPAPLLVLRTLKSDCLIGLKPGQAEQLDEKEKNWRNNGKYGIIQYTGPAKESVE